jgi:hypothetical protein
MIPPAVSPEEVSMKVTRILAVSIATLGLAGFSGVASADAAAGKANATRPATTRAKTWLP